VSAGADHPPGGGAARGPAPRDAAQLRVAVERVMGQIADAAHRAGRDPAHVTLVAVSKTVPGERLLAAAQAGLTVLGENRVQEAAPKIALLPNLRWHLVGPLQSNKARRAVELFDVIQTVDSSDLARRLDRIVREQRGLAPAGPVDPADRLPVLLQVNVDRDPSKAGLNPAGLEALLDEIEPLAALEIAGLMTIGQLVTDPDRARPTFRALRELSERLRRSRPWLGPALSMGMTDDFEAAVEEGATIVRVGRAIFGERPAP
jgi:pyridoxal phosphate enzyme (YggS family)